VGELIWPVPTGLAWQDDWLAGAREPCRASQGLAPVTHTRRLALWPSARAWRCQLFETRQPCAHGDAAFEGCSLRARNMGVSRAHGTDLDVSISKPRRWPGGFRRPRKPMRSVSFEPPHATADQTAPSARATAAVAHGEPPLPLPNIAPRSPWAEPAHAAVVVFAYPHWLEHPHRRTPQEGSSTSIASIQTTHRP
jgi:hypothetical protein